MTISPVLSRYSLTLTLSSSCTLSILLEIPLDYPHNFPQFTLRRKGRGGEEQKVSAILRKMEGIVNCKAVAIWMNSQSKYVSLSCTIFCFLCLIHSFVRYDGGLLLSFQSLVLCLLLSQEREWGSESDDVIMWEPSPL